MESVINMMVYLTTIRSFLEYIQRAAYEKDEDLPWIPISIPIMPLEQETEVYITSMSECGIVKITMEEKSDIELILKE